MGRGTGGHDAPFYDVVTACKEVDTDVLVLQEGWVPDDAEGDVLAVADALGYTVAGTFAVAAELSRPGAARGPRGPRRRGRLGGGRAVAAAGPHGRGGAGRAAAPRTRAAGRSSGPSSRPTARRSPWSAPTCPC